MSFEQLTATISLQAFLPVVLEPYRWKCIMGVKIGAK